MVFTESASNITQLIAMWQGGDKAAENALFTVLYRKLRGIAVHCLRTEPALKRLGATTLVHEAYLRLNRSDALFINNQDHLLALIGQVMRRIIIDQARSYNSCKRGGEYRSVEMTDGILASEAEADLILAVDQALVALQKRAPRQAQIVELRFFGGFDEEEVGAILKISSRTVRRDWDIARTHLRIAMNGAEMIGHPIENRVCL